MSTFTINIRQETPLDHAAVFELIEQAFANIEYSDHKEQFLVERLRKSEAFVPELSLVAEVDGAIVGYILVSKLSIKNQTSSVESLALAPVAVLPEFQQKGIGGQLIRKAHIIAQELGFKSIILLGHAEYYPKFGYQALHTFSITYPFDVPKENVMAIELEKGSLSNVFGMVEYPKEFLE
ncbi:N-acetyltransferase [Aureispira sp. CCB-E]|uniref:GNAT family N-acetyltransferase n=1 Tax=Aureispira sp. CCB-E TaxID=3051121 RepID=UPI00286878B7|nr:N-acetyltransferase [Aureispira sp. CCB-E]WMX13343.1 N-acetyltransferase [Aureispira sp. CCB-E]